MSRPMPRPPPVTRATLFFRRTRTFLSRTDRRRLSSGVKRVRGDYDAKAVGRCRQGGPRPSKLPPASAILGREGIPRSKWPNRKSCPPVQRLGAACAGRHCGACAGGARRALSRRFESRTTRSGGDFGRAGAGFGRRGNRKNPCPYNAHSAHFESRPRAAGGNSGGDLHQQGGARDEAARRPDGRANRRGNAVAWHFPLDRRENSCAATRKWSA